MGPLAFGQASSAAAATAAPLLINPRVLAGGTAFIIAALLMLLYGYRRRGYILYWVAGWMAIGTSMLLVVPQYPWERFGHAIYGLAQFTAILAGLAFVISADAYRSRPVHGRRYVMWLAPVLVWFVLAPALGGPPTAFAPGHLLIAGGMAAAGVAHLWLLRRAWLLGALIAGLTLLVLAALNAWIAFAAANPFGPLAVRGMFLQLALYLVTTLGMQLMTFEDMTYELRSANRRLEHAQAELRLLVTTDALTGCGNRRYFDEIIGRELHRHQRYGIPLSLLFVDIDRFKAINDTLGHEAGDRVLRQVAAFLLRKVRDADYVFRWGGDEFLILLSTTGAAARRKAEDLQQAFLASDVAGRLPSGVRLSCGTVEVPAGTADILPMVRIADERMYEDKRRAAEGKGERVIGNW